MSKKIVKWPRRADKRNFAGGLTEVERTVRKNGNILFDGSFWHDESLSQYQGERMLVKDAADSAFSTGPIDICLPHQPFNPLVRINKPNPICPDCKTSLRFVSSIDTQHHGLLSYYVCLGVGYANKGGCKTNFVVKRGELDVAPE